MKFSIIVPVYNVELYLSDCLDSILNQTYKDYEIICINDASTDGSYEKVLFYAEKNMHIRVVNNECNRGQSFCRNRGMELAKGDYLLFLDSDDMLYPDALCTLDRVVREYNVEMVCYGFTLRNESKSAKEKNAAGAQAIPCLGIQTGQEWFMEMSQRGTFLWGACMRLCKREFLLNKSLWFHEGIIHEDVLHTFQCALKASRVISTQKNVYIYRKREHSTTTTMNERRLDSLIIILGEILVSWRTCELEPGMSKAIEQCMYSYFFPVINKMFALFPEHKKMHIGTSADQFLFDVVKGVGQNQFHYIQPDSIDIMQIKGYNNIIVYGAGTVATEVISYLNDCQVKIRSIAVSDKSINMKKIAEINVYQIEELVSERDKALVIVSVVNHIQPSIVRKLKEIGFKNIMCVNTNRVSSK